MKSEIDKLKNRCLGRKICKKNNKIVNKKIFFDKNKAKELEELN